jgi:small subunit ribosomal protein S5
MSEEEIKKTNEDNKQETSVELSPEEASKKMEEIVDAEEEKAEEKERKERAREMTREERMRETPEDRAAREGRERLDSWVPKTQLGKDVQSGKVKDIDFILENGLKIMEPEIVDSLLHIRVELLDVGQRKGKFGGGQRAPVRQTQKTTLEGKTITFGVMAVVGDGKGHVGIGYGRASETIPAKEKAIRKAKLNIMKIKRGCASYDCSCDEEHSIPFVTEGKMSSVRIKLMPAPQGTGLVAGDQVKKILGLAGITDVYSRSLGKTKTTFNTGKATMKALEKLNDIKTD